MLADLPLLRLVAPEVAVGGTAGDCGGTLVEDRTDAVRLQGLAEGGGEQREEAVHAHRMGLQDEHAVVPVGHQPGEEIAFGVYEAEDVGVGACEEAETLAVGNSGADALAEEGLVNIRRVEREDFADDALGLIVACGHPAAVGGHYVDEVAVMRVADNAFHRPREHPGMAAQKGFFLAWRYYQLRASHCLRSCIACLGSALLKTALPATSTSAPAS